MPDSIAGLSSMEVCDSTPEPVASKGEVVSSASDPNGSSPTSSNNKPLATTPKPLVRTPRMKMGTKHMTPSASGKKRPSMGAKEESAKKKREEMERVKAEREEKKRQIEAEKQAKKLAFEKEKLEKQQEKDRVKQEKEREREALKQLKQQELESKLEERKKKDEEKRLIEEEKQRKLDEKKQKEEEETAKKQKVQQKFLGFFTKSSQDKSPQSATRIAEQLLSSRFLPLGVQAGQVRSPYVQEFAQTRFSKQTQAFDASIKDQDVKREELYLLLLKNGYIRPYRHKQSRRRLFNSDIIVIDSDNAQPGKKHKGKLMQFHEDIRPPWFGTWSKRSKQVTGRRPAAKDDSFLNYDVDSEAEWEEEEAGGESIKDDDSEKSADEDNYEIDNDIFVPHGYLSGSEGDEDEEIQEAGVFKEKDLLEARNRKLTKLRPISIGCVWEGDYKISAATLELLKPFSMVIIPPLPSDSVGVSQRKDSSKKSSKKLSGSQETKLNGQASAASPAVGDEKMVVD